MESSKLSELPPREQIAEICRHIYRAGLTTTSGGNLSILAEDGTIWVSPAAVDKGGLQAEDVVGLHPDGTQSGARSPSSESPFHRAIYRARPDLKAIIHAHPPALVAFSIARRRPANGILPEMQRLCGPVGYAPYALPGSEELGRGIAAGFEKGCNAVIMENHGAVAGGRDLLEAFVRFEALEFAARVESNAAALGATVETPAGTDKMETRSSHGDLPTPPVDRETLPARQALVQLVQRAYDQGLTASTASSMSLRTETGFLLTPNSIPGWLLSPGDVREFDLAHSGGDSDRYASVHRAIYANKPHIRSIIIASPAHLMAFAVCDARLDMRTIPESWILLQDIPSVEFGQPERDSEAFSRMFEPEHPAVLVRHDALYVTGATALQAFDRLEVAELSARALIAARQLGGVAPMDDEQVAELRRRFLAPGSPGLAVAEA